MSKTIVVIGATGGQGLPVVRHLLRSSTEHGSPSPSPWNVRALTRDINHKRAKELAALGIELVQGKCFIDSLYLSDSRDLHVLRLSPMGSWSYLTPLVSHNNL